MPSEPRSIRAVSSARLGDAETTITLILRPDGTLAVTATARGRRGGERVIGGVLDNAGRHALISAAGGVPHRVAEPATLVTADPEPSEVDNTHELYSWNARNRGWVAIMQGTEDDMAEAETRNYAAARRQNLTGSAFWVSEIDDIPGLSPTDLGIPVVE